MMKWLHISSRLWFSKTQKLKDVDTIKLLIWFELPKGDDQMERSYRHTREYPTLIRRTMTKGYYILQPKKTQNQLQKKMMQNQLQKKTGLSAPMATARHNADEVVVVATTTTSRQPTAETFATGDQLAIPPPPQDVGSARPAKERKKQRHTADQIQLMETVFKECSHPDHIRRQKLSEELGLTPKQVLFWFQNRRTQLRRRQNKAENAMLLEEHERLKWENSQLKADMSKLSCPRCVQLQEPSPETQQLFFENARLREQIETVLRVAAMYGIPPA